MSSQEHPSVVAIAGSCVSRDAFSSRFNPGYERSFVVKAFNSQSSMIALMSRRIEPEFVPINDMDDLDRMSVATDMSRVFLEQLAHEQADYLIVDFFADVYFGVIRLNDGRYLTDTHTKLWHTDFYQRLVPGEDYTRVNLQSQPDEYFALWAEAMDRFAAFVSQRCPGTTVVVVFGRFTDLVAVPGHAKPIPIAEHTGMRPIDLPLVNGLWSRLDEYCTATYGWLLIDLRAEEITSVADHPWGVFWVHYADAYYHRFLAELQKIHTRVATDVGRGASRRRSL